MKNFSAFLFSLFAIAATALVSGCDRADDSSPPENSGAGVKTVSFVDDVKPILQTHCVRCHNDESLFAGLNLMTQKTALRGSDRGPILIPGHADKSLLYQAMLLPPNESHSMPATGPKLNDAEREIIRKWIEDGAEWPEGKDGTMAPVKIDNDKV